MTKHTPAPWKVCPAQKGKLGGIEVATDKAWLERELICMMPHGPEQAQAEANARLIAAAPELLAALEIIMESIVWQGGVTYKIKDGNLEAAREAIAKAQG